MSTTPNTDLSALRNVEINLDKDCVPTYQVFSGLKNLACRAVISGGNLTNEYHIKPLVRINLSVFASIISGIVDDATLSITDPDGLLKLEWPVFMKIESVLGNEIIEDTLKKIDLYLEEQCNGL